MCKIRCILYQHNVLKCLSGIVLKSSYLLSCADAAFDDRCFLGWVVGRVWFFCGKVSWVLLCKIVPLNTLLCLRKQVSLNYFKTVFMLNIRVFHMIHFAYKHVIWTRTCFVWRIKCLIDHKLLSCLRVGSKC